MSSAVFVMLPGWGFVPAIWQAVIDQLRRQGMAPEQCQTPALPLTPQTTLEHTQSALSQVLPERAHLIGWSLGGELALAWTLSFPEHVASLTLISSTPCFMNRDNWDAGQPVSLLNDFDQRLHKDPDTLLKRFSMLIRHGDPQATRDHTLNEYLMKLGESDTDRLHMGLALLREIDLRHTCKDLLVPLQLIHGTNDAVTPLTAAEWLQTQTGATLHRIDHASHALPLTHANLLAEHLITFTGRYT